MFGAFVDLSMYIKATKTPCSSVINWGIYVAKLWSGKADTLFREVSQTKHWLFPIHPVSPGKTETPEYRTQWALNTVPAFLPSHPLRILSSPLPPAHLPQTSYVRYCISSSPQPVEQCGHSPPLVEAGTEFREGIELCRGPCSWLSGDHTPQPLLVLAGLLAAPATSFQRPVEGH